MSFETIALGENKRPRTITPPTDEYEHTLYESCLGLTGDMRYILNLENDASMTDIKEKMIDILQNNWKFINSSSYFDYKISVAFKNSSEMVVTPIKESRGVDDNNFFLFNDTLRYLNKSGKHWTRGISEMAYDSTGKQFAVFFDSEKKMIIYENNKFIRFRFISEFTLKNMDVNFYASGVAFSPSNTRIALFTKTAKLIHIFEVKDNTLIMVREISGVNWNVSSTAFDAHGELIGFASANKAFIHDITNNRTAMTLQHDINEEVISVTFGSDSITTVSHPINQDDLLKVYFWDKNGKRDKEITLSGEAFPALNPVNNRLTFSPDGKRIASWSYGRNRMTLWNVRTGDLVFDTNRNPFSEDSSEIHSVTFNPDGTMIAIARLHPDEDRGGGDNNYNVELWKNDFYKKR